MRSFGSARSRFSTNNGGFGAGGVAHLSVDGQVVSQKVIPATVPVIYSMSGETFDVGRTRALGRAISAEFNGRILGVTL